MNYKLIGSAATAAILGCTVIYLSFNRGTNFQETSLNLLIVILGLAIGWLLGILVSPYSKKEEGNFSEYSKALGVFVSGYLIGKTDKAIEALFQPDFILDSAHGFRFISFITALIISLVITFVFRSYE